MIADRSVSSDSSLHALPPVPSATSLYPRRLSSFAFTAKNFRDPSLLHGLNVLDVPCADATDETLEGYGHLISSADERSVANANFEIVRWPQPGWRSLDPHTGDEAGTTEGDFEVHWSGDYFFGHNLAIASTSNFYLDGLGAPPEQASRTAPAAGDGTHIYLWMSDYHPDGAQLSFSGRSSRGPSLCALAIGGTVTT